MIPFAKVNLSLHQQTLFQRSTYFTYAHVNKRNKIQLPVKALIKEKTFFKAPWVIYPCSFIIFTKIKPSQ
jgi:hypothetical protein